MGCGARGCSIKGERIIDGEWGVSGDEGGRKEGEVGVVGYILE